MSIIDRARENPVVDVLFKEVDAVTPIHVTVVPGCSWASSTADAATEIEAGGDTKHPDAALYHELLHARFKISGYQQHVTIVPTNARVKNELFSLLGPLDNELQHHRIYQQYLAAGFPAENFYDDDDGSSFMRIREELRRMKRSAPIELFLLKLLTVIAPGGRGDAEKRRRLKNFLMIQAGPEKASKLMAIEAEFASWSASASMDVRPTLQAIVRELGDFEGAWVGSSTNFPQDGFFTGPSFDIKTAEAFLARDRS